jgi:hypothetical protein
MLAAWCVAALDTNRVRSLTAASNGQAVSAHAAIVGRIATAFSRWAWPTTDSHAQTELSVTAVPYGGRSCHNAVTGGPLQRRACGFRPPG